MASGYILLHRKLLDNPIMQKSNYLSLWIYLLLNANYKDSELIFNNNLITVKRGSFVSSYRKIAEKLDISPNTVKFICDYFSRVSMLHTSSNTKQTVFTIVKYDDYQDSCTRAAHELHTGCTRGDTRKAFKEGEEVKEFKKTTSSADRTDEVRDALQRAIQLYEIYPVKKNKSTAIEVIKKHLLENPGDFDRMLSGVTAFADSVYAKTCPKDRFIRPDHWFEAGKWDDDPALWAIPWKDFSKTNGSTTKAKLSDRDARMGDLERLENKAKYIHEYDPITGDRIK